MSLPYLSPFNQRFQYLVQASPEAPVFYSIVLSSFARWHCEIAINHLQDPPCTLNWGYMVPNSGYLGPYRGLEGLGLHQIPTQKEPKSLALLLKKTETSHLQVWNLVVIVGMMVTVMLVVIVVVTVITLVLMLSYKNLSVLFFNRDLLQAQGYVTLIRGIREVGQSGYLTDILQVGIHLGSRHRV